MTDRTVLRNRRAAAEHLYGRWSAAEAAVRETFADTYEEAEAMEAATAAHDALVGYIDGTELDGTWLDPRGSSEDNPERGSRA